MTCLYGTRFYVKNNDFRQRLAREHSSLRRSLLLYLYIFCNYYIFKKKENEGKKLNVNHLPRTTGPLMD